MLFPEFKSAFPRDVDESPLLNSIVEADDHAEMLVFAGDAPIPCWDGICEMIF